MNNTLSPFVVSMLHQLTPISVVCGVSFYLWHWVYRHRHNKRQQLSQVFLIGSAAAAIPTGLCFVCAGVWPEILQEISGYELNVAIAGVALLYVSIESVWKGTVKGR
jgi:hypothetical protein